MAEYSTDADLYSYGLVRGSIPNPGRLIASVDTTGDTLSLDVHGFADDDRVTFRAEAGGALPAPLVESTTYFAISTSDNLFQVALTAGGAAIDLTTAGSRILVIPEFSTQSSRAWASRIIDDMLPAHAVPLPSPYPDVIVMTSAELAIGKLATSRGVGSESLTAMVDAARVRIERWAKGIPVRDPNIQTHTNKAASAVVPYNDSRGWNRFGSR